MPSLLQDGKLACVCMCTSEYLQIITCMCTFEYQQIVGNNLIESSLKGEIPLKFLHDTGYIS